MPFVGPGREPWFFALFILQYVVGFAWFGLLTSCPGANCPTTISSLASLIAVATVNSVLMVEGWAVVAEWFLQGREKAGKEKGRREREQEIKQSLIKQFKEAKTDSEKQVLSRLIAQLEDGTVHDEHTPS